MTKADEMFEELGYIKVNYLLDSSIPLKENLCYEKHGGISYLVFDLKHQIFYKTNEGGFLSGHLDMQELQAINQKCKELGWIE